MKVIFLDIDGVLRTKRSMLARKRAYMPGEFGKVIITDFDVECVDRLRCVVEATGAEIVVSSSWRNGDNWLSLLLASFAWAHWADPPIIDRTPHLIQPTFPAGYHDAHRGDEIERWLKTEAPKEVITRYAIVDDDADMLPHHMPFFVQTTFARGLDRFAADHLCDVLERA